MSDCFVALFLGIVQGLTEFLPVSSSGHLVLFQGLLKGKWVGDVVFDVSLHLGTTLAIIVFFFKDIVAILKGLVPKNFDTKQGFLVLCLFITTLITGIIGIAFKDTFEAMFASSTLVACTLIITGFITFFTDKINIAPPKERGATIKSAIVVGIFQAIAIIPGISRSGSTIFAGVATGMERSFAAEYSLLAAIPAVLGAGILEWGDRTTGFTAIHFIGIVSSFIVGLISLKFLIWSLKKHRFFIFSIYCWGIGSMYLLGKLFIYLR